MRRYTRSLCGAFFAITMSSCVANSQQSGTRELLTYAHSSEFIMPEGIKNPQARAFFNVAQKWMNDRPVHVVPGPNGGITLENEPQCKRLLELFQQREDSARHEDYAILEPLEASTDTEQVFSSIQADRPDIPLNRMYSFGTKYDFPSPELKHVDCKGPCPDVETVADWSALYHLTDWERVGQDGWLIYNELDCMDSEDRRWCPGTKYDARGYWAFLGSGWTDFAQFFSFRQHQNRLSVTASRKPLPISAEGSFSEFGASFPVMMNGDVYIFRTNISPIKNEFTSMRVRDKVNPAARDFLVTAETVLSIARLARGGSSIETKCRYSFYTTNLK